MGKIRMAISKEEFAAGCVVGASIGGMVIAFMLALGDMVSDPAISQPHPITLELSPSANDYEYSTYAVIYGQNPDDWGGLQHDR